MKLTGYRLLPKLLQPAGELVAKCRTLDQARAVVTFLDAASEKTLRNTVALTASRGRGKVTCQSAARFNRGSWMSALPPWDWMGETSWLLEDKEGRQESGAIATRECAARLREAKGLKCARGSLEGRDGEQACNDVSWDASPAERGPGACHIWGAGARLQQHFRVRPIS